MALLKRASVLSWVSYAMALGQRKLVPALDHSSSLMAAPPVHRVSSLETPAVLLQGNHLEQLQPVRFDFKSTSATVETLCPRGRNGTAICSGNGICNNNFECECASGFSGFDCSVKVQCPENCNSGTCNTDGYCECGPNTFGVACEQHRCPKQCSFHGVCDIRQGCQCFDGFAGPDCSKTQCPDGCNGNGVCVDGNCVCSSEWTGSSCAVKRCEHTCMHGDCTNNTCVCNAGWEGNDCSLNSCQFPEGNTTVSGCGDHGKCTGSGECKCNLGWTGARCSKLACLHDCGTGVCVDGVCSNKAANVCPQGCGSGVCFKGACVCETGYNGTRCELRKCKDDCNNAGKCNNGTCVCDKTHWGKACENLQCPSPTLQGTAVDIFFSGSDSVLLKRKPGASAETATSSRQLKPEEMCSSHGKCQQNGTCACDPGFDGPACSTMVCPAHCSDHGVCENFTCKCNPGWTGMMCASRTCDPRCEASGHGACSNGECLCQSGWGGPTCEEPVCNPPCSENGKCVGGACFCKPGFSGRTCAFQPCADKCGEHGICLNGVCACEDGWKGKTCETMQCPNDCSGNGECIEGKNGTHVCNCFGFFQGESCQKCDRSKYSGKKCDLASCVDDCSGNGICNNGTCFCAPGFAGVACKTKVCVNQCSQHGTCTDSGCQCNPGYSGVACEHGSNKQCPNQCSGHGVCDVDTGKCVCEDQFGGRGCGLPKCKFGCSGHGTCNVTTSTCECDDLYTGDGCEIRTCEDRNNCTGHGLCNRGKCFCQNGWTDSNCSTAVCPSQCNGHGSCDNGVCQCFEGYTGHDCGMATCTIGDSVKLSGVLCNVTSCGASVRLRCESAPPGETSVPSLAGGFEVVKRISEFNVIQCEGCSGHGKCRGNRCTCDEGWGGKVCSIPIGCPKNCSGHGVCDPDAQFCTCSKHWEGHDCSTRRPSQCNECSGHGECQGPDNACLCTIGWSGSKCGCPTVVDNTKVPKELAGDALQSVQEFNKLPLIVCSGHGTCDGSKCQCEGKWGGHDCSNPDWMSPSYNCAAECVFTCMKQCSTTGTLDASSHLRADNNCYTSCSKECNSHCLDN